MSRAPPEGEKVRAVAEAWGAPLARYAASILRDADLARDAVQDVLLRLCDPAGTAFGGFPEEEPAVRAWLFKAVRNRCIDLLRKEGRMSLLEDHVQSPAVQMRLVGGDEHDPAQQADRHEQAGVALAALDRLPTLQREALRLKFAGELSYAQIADTMGKSVSHVGVLIHEGLKTLRQQLA